MNGVDEKRKRIRSAIREAFSSMVSQGVEMQNKIASDIIAELEKSINELPDNPRIKRLSKQAFVIGSKDLDTRNWTSQYYDFEQQYREIIRLISGKTLESVDKKIKEILKNGQTKNNHGVIYKFHPDVLEHLYKLYFGDESHMNELQEMDVANES